MTIESSREVQGSPPRARGEAMNRLRCWTTIRITPACAGRSPEPMQPAKSQGDHPRVRGEKRDMLRALGSDDGSPPRARGEGPDAPANSASGWITPACAGRS